MPLDLYFFKIAFLLISTLIAEFSTSLLEARRRQELRAAPDLGRLLKRVG
jgi:hypothetical protein